MTHVEQRGILSGECHSSVSSGDGPLCRGCEDGAGSIREAHDFGTISRNDDTAGKHPMELCGVILCLDDPCPVDDKCAKWTVRELAKDRLRPSQLQSCTLAPLSPFVVASRLPQSMAMSCMIPCRLHRPDTGEVPTGSRSRDGPHPLRCLWSNITSAANEGESPPSCWS